MESAARRGHLKDAFRDRIAAMRTTRSMALALLALATLGSLAVTGGYAWYLRSGRYRNSCAQALSKALGLPAEISRIVPRSRRCREFQQVRVWLPERRDEAAFCERALLTRTPLPGQPKAYELDLRGGQCEISARTWLREDYRFMLESGLRPGFSPKGPRRVVLQNMDLAFEHDGFRAALHDASGVVSFEEPPWGRATLWCGKFNGYATDTPVTLKAEFTAQPAGIRLDLVTLTVPELPIAIVGLARLAGRGPQSGSFSGQVLYREMDTGRELTVRGKVFHVDLNEYTAAFLARPWQGTVPELELEELTLVDHRPQRLRFRGVLSNLSADDVLAPWGLGANGTRATLRIQAADFTPAGVEHFVASACCDDIDLAKMSDALGWGRITGRARLVIDDLTIDQNRLTALDAEIRVGPNDGTPNSIDRDLLSELLRRTLGLPLPSFLPERFEYTQLGVRLEVRDELLYVFGTHGPRQKAILSVLVGGEELPVLFEPESPIDLRVPLDDLRSRLQAAIQEGLRRLAQGGAPRARPTLPDEHAGPE